MTTQRRFSRYVLAGLVGLAATVSAAGPASAHTGVTIEPARAGAKNAVATVNAEAESDSAGVAKVQIFLPAGIAPADITQVSLPKKWKLTKQLDSYTVEGPALKVGVGARHKVRIRQLPTTATVSFKVLQTYSDGRTDRWIEVPTKENPEPDDIAPTVKLAGGSGTAPSSSPAAPPSEPTASAAAAPSATTTSTPSSAVLAEPPPAAGDQNGTPWWWIGGLGLLVVFITGGFVALTRRRREAA